MKKWLLQVIFQINPMNPSLWLPFYAVMVNLQGIETHQSWTNLSRRKSSQSPFERNLTEGTTCLILCGVCVCVYVCGVCDVCIWCDVCVWCVCVWCVWCVCACETVNLLDHDSFHALALGLTLCKLFSLPICLRYISNGGCLLDFTE
jgi:hypothetical protein